MTRRQEKPFRMGLAEPRQTSCATGRVHRTIAGSSPQRGCLCRLGGGTWHRGCGARARAVSPAEPTMVSCKGTEIVLQCLPCCGPWSDQTPAKISPFPSATSDNEVWCIYNLFCLLLLLILTGIHSPAA